MTHSSRRIFLALTGALLLGAIVQRTDVFKSKETSGAAKPKKPVTTPTSTAKAIESPKPTSSKEAKSPKPTNTPTQTSSPQPTQTAVLEGVVIAKSEDLILRQTRVFSVKDTFGISTGYSLTRTSRGIVAFDTKCTHAGAPCLLSDTLLQCPAHGSAFDPENGEVVRGPAVEPLKSYRAFEANGEIRIVIS